MDEIGEEKGKSCRAEPMGLFGERTKLKRKEYNPLVRALFSTIYIFKILVVQVKLIFPHQNAINTA